MSTIGVGRAIREQNRAAQHARRDGRGWSTAEEEAVGTVPSSRVPCAGCGTEIALAGAFQTEDGLTCTACHHDAADAIDASATGRRDLLAGLVPWGAVALQVFTLANGRLDHFTGKGGMGWMLLAAVGVVLAVLTGLFGLRAVRDALRGDPLGEEAADPASVALAAASTATAALGGLLTAVLFFFPYGLFSLLFG
jgi:hypothetical protein